MNKFFLVVLFVVTLISCSGPEPRKPVIRKTGSFMKESIKRNKALNTLEEDMLKAKLKKDSIHNYFNSSKGFWYFYNKRDSLQTKYPEKGDEVIYTYEVKRLNDSILYSKEEIGKKHYLVDKEELITGLQDGLKLMHPGEEVTFLFPSHKAFGYTGNERVMPNEPLIYTVELIEINKK
ncbi:MAG: gliding motility-associated peptidyl-prolyl isomerase GldI [Flavobacteriia bacterium]|nr:MAG: gliding motility-associated peptidyl-prolyl isomerase GldI [Flavobacteriia bacterium]